MPILYKTEFDNIFSKRTVEQAQESRNKKDLEGQKWTCPTYPPKTPGKPDRKKVTETATPPSQQEPNPKRAQ